MLFLLKLMSSIILLPIFLIVVWSSLTIFVAICEVFADGIKEFNFEIKKKDE